MQHKCPQVGCKGRVQSSRQEKFQCFELFTVGWESNTTNDSPARLVIRKTFMFSQGCSQTIKVVTVREKIFNNQLCANSPDLDCVCESESSFATMLLSTGSCLSIYVSWPLIKQAVLSVVQHYLTNRMILQRRHTSKIAADKLQFLSVYHEYNSCYCLFPLTNKQTIVWFGVTFCHLSPHDTNHTGTFHFVRRWRIFTKINMSNTMWNMWTLGFITFDLWCLESR